MGGAIHVHAEISGLISGAYGFQIHEYGVWSKHGLSSGGHFNPTMSQHGGVDRKKRHVGDFGNITANSNGNAKVDMDNTQLSFPGRNSILGPDVVVHEKADDLKTPPAGNAEARLAVVGGRCRQALSRSSGGGEGSRRPRIIRSGALANRGLRVS
jgi:Cu-Zn family superoxide dismutase